MRRIWKIWLGALALLPNAPAQAQWGHSRDVYVFEDYVLDLRARMEGWIPGSPNEVRDCPMRRCCACHRRRCGG